MADPCLPQKYRWDWVDCNQDSSPSIIAVTLPDKHLNGTIPPSFATLSALVKLDLARNNLSGSIPEALATLSNLNYLNLIDNDLNGSVPIGLSEKQQRGELIMRQVSFLLQNKSVIMLSV
ncbi:putative receptor-like protein kinase At3g46340 [Cryptomeria japonica]|uniref:putative receptor-like protein kinase At3g46340 n=1 Tax=Cryptomeria japonica TaxID=3369 RepID=UPI0027DA5C70|nr:putative receptor-like protein kinase At3g46340 [Cryptomeria japonica]